MVLSITNEVSNQGGVLLHSIAMVKVIFNAEWTFHL